MSTRSFLFFAGPPPRRRRRRRRAAHKHACLYLYDLFPSAAVHAHAVTIVFFRLPYVIIIIIIIVKRIIIQYIISLLFA